jgi:predicted metal-dependent phosphoesterase TrpH
MVDLHIHTSCSDGALAPAQVVDLAAAMGLSAIGIADHDTLAGNEEAVARGRAVGLPVVPGVEISTHTMGVTFHVLGYGMRRTTATVSDCFAFLDESRRTRNPRMIARLQGLGVPITLEEVTAEASGAVLGRPHFARVLLKKGIVKTMQEAFDRYLGRGKPGYADKERLSPRAACAVIREAGGLAVLAHPGTIEADHPGRLPDLLQEMCSLGLAGLEAYYSGHTSSQTRRYRKLAREHGLLVTGGSDFHAEAPEGPRIGVGHGDLRVPDACYETLMARLNHPV